MKKIIFLAVLLLIGCYRDNNKSILIMGDSRGARERSSWNNYIDADVKNIAIRQSTMQEIINEQVPKIDDINPRNIVLFAGVNDPIYVNDINLFIQQIQYIRDYCNDRGINLIIIDISVNPNQTQFDPAIFEPYRNYLETLPEYVSIQWTSDYFIDSVHYNNSGRELVAEIINDLIK